MDIILLIRYSIAKTICTVGRWLVERAIEIAGEGSIDVWFETSIDKPLPSWLISIMGLAVFWLAIVVLFAATGGN